MNEKFVFIKGENSTLRNTYGLMELGDQQRLKS